MESSTKTPEQRYARSRISPSPELAYRVFRIIKSAEGRMRDAEGNPNGTPGYSSHAILEGLAEVYRQNDQMTTFIRETWTTIADLVDLEGDKRGVRLWVEKTMVPHPIENPRERAFIGMRPGYIKTRSSKGCTLEHLRDTLGQALILQDIYFTLIDEAVEELHKARENKQELLQNLYSNARQTASGDVQALRERLERATRGRSPHNGF